MKKWTIIIPALMAAFCSYGQQTTGADENEFTLGVQLRSRAEYRNGAIFPREIGERPAFFINERARISMGYSRSHLSIGFSGQHIGVWGQDSQTDRNGRFMLNEAWANLEGGGFFAKLGRQPLVYDDERILGSLDWNVSGRHYDAVKLGYESAKNKVHLILAFNQNEERVSGTYYHPGGQPFKTMQTLWYHFDTMKDFDASLLFINLGQEAGGYLSEVDPDHPEGKTAVRYMQTMGTFVNYRPGDLAVSGTYYYQSGKNIPGQTVQAMMWAVNASYKISPEWKVTVASDWLSGDSGNNPDKYKAFDPLYGTHHKFYGTMDYFYASAFIDGHNPGLWDNQLGVNYTVCPKVNMSVNYHYFSTVKKVSDRYGEELKKRLGSEIDLQVNWNIMKDVSLSAGYSTMLGNSTMRTVKGGMPSHWQDWGWISININPRIFSTKW